MPTVFVLGNDQLIREMWKSAGYNIVSSPAYADILQWTGGADIDPRLYNQKPIPTTGPINTERDAYEIDMFSKYPDKIKVGICRGSQFLNVMNGGSLWQDVDNHTQRHILYSKRHPQGAVVTSTHHQMMRPAPAGKVLAWAFESTRMTDDAYTLSLPNRDHSPENPLDSKQIEDADVEAVMYEDTATFCFQPHPEYGIYSCYRIFFDLFEENLLAA